MSLKRRDFLKFASVGAVATTVRFPFEAPDAAKLGEQKLHQDYQSNNPGMEYYFLGNGKILAALQTSQKPESGTHCGLLVMSTEHFGRKISTYLYHPERGLQNSRFIAVIDGKAFGPEFSNSSVHWEYPDSIPTVVIEWEAAGCKIREEIFCPIHDSALVRAVTIQNNTAATVNGSSTVLLYPNLMYFDEYHVDRTRMTLTAMGYQTLRLFSPNETIAGDRHLNIKFGEIPAGEKRSITFFLTLNVPREEFERKSIEQMRKETSTYWVSKATLATPNEGLNHLFNSSKSALRAAVAESGKTDGGIWQYNFEWVRDQSLIAVGAVMTGQASVAEAIYRRNFTRSVDDEGKTIDASRHRPPETIELDQNGELLYGLWMYWVWTGDDSLIKEFWQKIKKVADYVLQPIFMDPAIGLVKNTREFWERDAAFGVKEGYELAYQAWNIVGLECIADMAKAMNEPANAKKWRDASQKMKSSFLHHPKYSLVADGRFTKRRLTNGEVQRTFEPPNRKSMPPGTPLNVEKVSYCDPDTANVLPIMLGIVDPKSPVAMKTLESMEHLWNQRWDTGGYARYDVSSEPDSPGAWPFPSIFIARSYFEAGNDEKVWRVLNWLLSIQGGKAGAWFEYYGDRPTPPLPPVGFVVWNWAEVITFFVHHLLGVRPSPDNLIIKPRLLKGLDELHATAIVRSHKVTIHIKRATKEQFALVDGKRMKLIDGAVTLPLPTRNIAIEIQN